MSLPSGYKRLEYIQSSGKQWIDTGFKPNQDTRVVMNCYVISFNSCDMFIFGARVSAGNTAFYVAADDTNTKWFISYGSDVQNPVGTCIGHHSIDMNKNSVSIDDAITTLSASTFQSASNLLLFATNTAGSADSQRGTMNLYSCQIYDNGTLVRDFIPCQKPDGTIGLWDDVNSVFYGNAGTGTFTAGSVLAIAADASEITKLEYIESSGTQYIDSGFIPNQDTMLEMVCSPLSVVDANDGTGFIPYGAGESYTSRAFECYTANSQYEFNYDGQYGFIGSPPTGQKLSISHNKNEIKLIIDGSTTLTKSFNYQSFTAPYTMTLFAIHRSSVIRGLMKLYSCQIYDNGTLIRDYIAAKLSDGTVGLYDKLHGLLYINMGTGTFTAGPVVASPSIFVNIDGIWKPINDIYVNINNIWQKST